jgi:UDP-glucose 4-epimerase
VRRVVFASSAVVYGRSRFLPTWEECPLGPSTPHACGIVAAESLLWMYARRHRLSTVALRLSNVYGPRQDPFAGGVVARFCHARAKGKLATVHGEGHQTRDLLFVDDAVTALLAAGAVDAEGAINVGSSQETTVIEVAKRLGVERLHASARVDEVGRSCLAVKRAAFELGWAPHTSLEDGLAQTLAWHQVRSVFDALER